MSNNGTCTHIKVTGVRCGSPALTGEEFCYFHQNAHRGVRRPKQSRLHPIALIEDEESIQYALMEVINALMRNTIDPKRATLILRALHIAVKNASRVKFGIQGKNTVTKVPDYSAPTEEHEAIAMEADLPAVAANPNLPIGLEGPHYWEQRAEAARQAAKEDALRFAAEAQAREENRRRFAEERAQEAKARAESRKENETGVPHVSPSLRDVGGADTVSVPSADATPPHDFKKPSPPQQPNKSTFTPSTSAPKRKPPIPVKATAKQRTGTVSDEQ